MMNDLKIKLSLLDVLPSKDELLKYSVLSENRETLIEWDISDEVQKKLDQYYQDCIDLNLDYEASQELLDTLTLARLFYLAQLEIEIDEVEGVKSTPNKTTIETMNSNEVETVSGIDDILGD